MRAVGAGVAVVLLVSAGCGDLLAPRICTAEARPGLWVDVRDSVTGSPLARGSRVIARAGAYADTADFRADPPPDGTLPDVTLLGLAHERPGTYEVTVERPGYRSWRRDGFQVRAGECHVRTVEVMARLQPVPWAGPAGVAR